MNKIITLEDYFPRTGEPTIQVVGSTERGHTSHEKVAFDSAARSPAYEYIKTVVPREGTTVVLVNALGAFEAYDSNRNGDGFNARPYKVGLEPLCGHPGCRPKDLGGWVSDEECIPRHYQSFERGGIFKHHVNKDMSKSLGKILKAFWNTRMLRIELLLEIVNDRDRELVRKLAEGVYPEVSMGCKVRWDVCTVCGHRAPTRKQYCEHAAAQLRQIDPETGILSAVLNPSPDWFDLSMVLRHADRIGNVMAKIAEDRVYAVKSADMGDKVARFFAKQAKIRKLSEIAKAITGQPAAVRFGPDIEAIREYRRSVLNGGMDNVEPLTSREVTAMDAFSLPEVFSTLGAASAPLSVGETARVWLQKTGHDVPEYALDRLVALQPVLREVLASYPSIEAEFGDAIAVDERFVRPALRQKLGSWVEKRALFGDWVHQQAHQPGQLNGPPAGPGYAYNAQEPAKTDPLTMTDFNTGHTYRTTRGAAMSANNQDMRTLVGGAALGSTLAFSALHAANPLGRAAAALGFKNRPGLQALGHVAMAVPIGWAGAKGVLSGMNPYRNPTYTTDQGVSVSGGTEFKGASVADALAGPLGATTTLHKLAWDYMERTQVWSDDLEKTLRNKIARETPHAEIVAFLDHPASVAEKAAALVGDAERRTYDSTEPPGVDLQRLAERIGALIL